MTKRITRWLLCIVLVLVLAFSFAFAACGKDDPEQEQPGGTTPGGTTPGGTTTQVTATFVGGDGATGTAPAAITVNKGSEITFPANTFSKTDFTFDGWSDGTNTYQPGAKLALNENKTFTAQWKFNGTPAPGGDIIEKQYQGKWVNIDPVGVYEDGYIEISANTVSASFADRSYEGLPISKTDSEYLSTAFSFTYSYNETDYTTEFGFIQLGEVTLLRTIGKLSGYSKLSLESVYIKEGETLPQSELVEDWDNGTYTTKDNATKFIVKDGVVEFYVSILNHSPYQNYELTIWGVKDNRVYAAFLDKVFQLTFDSTGEDPIITTDDLLGTQTVYTFDPEYLLQFELGDHASVEYLEGVKLRQGQTTNLPNPAAEEGWQFDGWKDSDGTTYQANAEFTMPKHDVTLTAQWKSNGGTTTDTYTLSFELGDHAAANAKKPDDIQAQYYDIGNPTILPEAPDAEDGYVFVCWNDGENTYNAGAEYYLNKESDVVFTAQWKEESEPGIPVDTITCAISEENGDDSIMIFLNFPYMESLQDCSGAILVNGGDDVYATFDFTTNDNDEVIIENLKDTCESLSNLKITSTMTSITISFNYGNNQTFSVTKNVHNLTIKNYDGDGTDAPFPVATDSYMATLFEMFETNGVTGYIYDGQQQGTDWSAEYVMPDKNDEVELIWGTPITVDLSKFEGTYVSDTPFAVGPFEIVKIVVTPSGTIEYYEEGDSFGTLVTFTPTNDKPVVVTLQLNPDVTATFEGDTVTLSLGRGTEPVEFKKYVEEEGPAFNLDDYNGEWDLEGNPINIGPIEQCDGFKIENGEISLRYVVDEGHGYEDSVAPTLSVVDGKNTITWKCGIFDLTVTFESETQATLYGTDSFDELNGTLTKQQAAPENHTVTLNVNGELWRTVTVDRGKTLEADEPQNTYCCVGKQHY